MLIVLILSMTHLQLLQQCFPIELYTKLYTKLYTSETKETTLTRSRHNYYLRNKAKLNELNKAIYLRSKDTLEYKEKKKQWNRNYLDKQMLLKLIK